MRSTLTDKPKEFIDLDGEIWVPVFRDYEISNMGRVASSKGRNKRIIKSYPNNRGYHLIHPRINGRRVACTVHRLVALIFLKNINPLKVTVNHHFGKDDNRATSLSWMTYSENSQHGADNDLLHRGSKHYKTSLDETQVRTIKSLRGDIKTKYISEYFNVSSSNIGCIFRGQSWGHVSV